MQSIFNSSGLSHLSSFLQKMSVHVSSRVHWACFFVYFFCESVPMKFATTIFDRDHPGPHCGRVPLSSDVLWMTLVVASICAKSFSVLTIPC